MPNGTETQELNKIVEQSPKILVHEIITIKPSDHILGNKEFPKFTTSEYPPSDTSYIGETPEDPFCDSTSEEYFPDIDDVSIKYIFLNHTTLRIEIFLVIDTDDSP